MIDPLVHHAKRPLDPAEMCHRVFAQDGKPEGGGKLVDPVVDLRVTMVGPSGQDDAGQAPPLHLGQNLLAPRPHLGLEGGLLAPG